MLAHWHSIRVLVWAAILLVSAIVLAFMPLMGVLGFEFAFVIGLIASLAAADLAATYVRRLRTSDAPPLARAIDPGRLVAAIWARAALVNLSLLLPPLVIIVANGLRVRNCDWTFGFVAYFLLPLLSVLAATAIGVLCGFVAGERRKLSNALPFLVYIGSLLGAIWRFYSEPPVFIYNLFAGYFPGNLYDESVAFHLPYLWSRLFQLTLLTSLLALVVYLIDVPVLRLVARRRRPAGLRLLPALTALALMVISLTLWAKSGTLGFAIDADDIKRKLGGRYESANFVIYYPPGGEIERDIAIIAEDHEFRLAQLVRTFGVEPEERIVSFYFATGEDKFASMGARKVYMAKPWLSEIYINHYRFPHPILRHEIAHVVAGVFGDPIFNLSVGSRLGLPVAFNVGLIEGIAVAGDWPDHRSRMTPHESVKAMLELGVAPPVAQILSPGFLTFSAARSYTLAGSFVRFLLTTQGPARLRVLYRNGGDFMAAYGRPQSAFVADWRAMIAATPIPADAAEIVRERFRRPSILARPCPHAIARRLDRVGKLLTRGRLATAITEMERVCSDGGGEPRHQLALARLLARADSTAAATAIFTTLADDSEQVSSTLRVDALLELVALALDRDDSGEARRLLARAEALPVDEESRRGVLVRRFAVDHEGPAGPALRAYFWGHNQLSGWDPVILATRAAAAIALEPDLGLAHYLLGYVSRGRGAPADSARLFATAIAKGLPDPLVVRECAYKWAASAYLAGDLAAVRQAAAILASAEQPLATRLHAHDWRERAHWKASGALLPIPATSR